MARQATAQAIDAQTTNATLEMGKSHPAENEPQAAVLVYENTEVSTMAALHAFYIAEMAVYGVTSNMLVETGTVVRRGLGRQGILHSIRSRFSAVAHRLGH